MASRLLTGAKWMGVAQATRVLAQLATVILLARLLDPSDFGLMGMCLVVVNLGNLVRDLGIGAAIVQRSTLAEREYGTIFWANLGIGTCVGLCVALLAGLIAQLLFKEPRVLYVLYCLAPSLPLLSAAATLGAHRERNKDFKSLALVEGLSSAISLVAAIVAARAGWGVYSLALQSVAHPLLCVVGHLILGSRIPKMGIDVTFIRSIVGFSGNLAAFNAINFVARNADAAIVARMLGAVQLGLYTQAYKIMLFPVQNLTGIFIRTLYPYLSSAKDSGTEMTRIYFNSVTLLAALTAPLMLGLWLLRSEFVHVVLGEKWSGMIPLLFWLAPVGFLQSIVSTTGVVFMALGETRLLMKAGAISTGIQLTVFVFAAPYGIEFLTECYFYANIAVAVLFLGLVNKLIGAPPLLLLARLKPVLLTTAVMGLALLALLPLCSGMDDRQRLALITIAGVATYLAVLLTTAKKALHQTISELRK